VTIIFVDIEGIRKKVHVILLALCTLVINLAEIETSVNLLNIAAYHRNDDVRDRLQASLHLQLRSRRYYRTTADYAVVEFYRQPIMMLNEVKTMRSRPRP
jgi:hypothetical protein